MKNLASQTMKATDNIRKSL
ncbi:MAG: hypothetical protein ACK5PB_02605 [Pirellula sp.]